MPDGEAATQGLVMVTTNKSNSHPLEKPRRMLLLVDPDPLLRWSVATHLRNAFNVQVTDTLDGAGVLLSKNRFDAMVVGSGYSEEGIRMLESQARQSNAAVIVVHLVTGVRDRQADPGIKCLEKPFALASLSNVLGVGEG